MGRLRQSATALVGLLFLSTVLMGSLTSIQSTATAFDGSGGGSYGDPYLITDCEELQSIGATENTENKLYWLANDIDCSATSGWNSGAGFAPIEYFEGALDGRGHTISGLFIDREENEVGLFREASEAFITSLYFDETTDITGATYVGVVAGEANSTVLRDIISAGSVSGDDYVGGLVGRANGWQDDLVIEKSESSATVEASGWSGGFVGYAQYGHTIRDSHFTGSVVADGAGGIIGLSAESCGYRYINNAFVEGSISGVSVVGGLVGRYQNVTCHEKEINNSVSIATLSGGSTAKGAIVGQEATSAVNITNTFFDGGNAGTSDCEGIAGSGTYDCSDIAENLAPSDAPYNQWDFYEIWDSTSGTSLRSPFPLLSGPSAPQNLVLTEGEQIDSVDVSWSEPASDGGFDINYYRVEIQEAGGDWSAPFEYDTTSDTNTYFEDLRLDTAYEVRVQARTDYAGGAWLEGNYETDEADVVLVDTCEELMAFDDDAANRYSTLKLTADIDCSETEGLEPIGSSDEWDGNSYRGVFDGQAYTISGFTLDSEDYGVGLFKYVSRGELKNVTLEDGSITGAGDVGSLAGEVYRTDISNVHSRMDVSAYDGRAGGLVGYIDNGNQSSNIVFEYLSYDGTIECLYDCGGLFGELESDYGRSITLRSSYSAGSLIADLDYEGSNFGGLIGDLEVYSEDDDYVGEVLIENSYSQMDISGWENVGGVFGTIDVNTDDYDNAIATITIDNVYGSGNVTGAYDVGGFAGQLEDYYYEGEMITIGSSFSAGSVSDVTEGDGSEINGFVGYYDEGDIAVQSSNNYYDDEGNGIDCSGANELEGCTAIDESDLTNYFKDSTNAPLDEWDFEDTWYTVEGDYPRLHGSDYERPDSPDDDSDGATDEVENAGPNGGDANNDGTLDSEQANVASMIDPVTGEYAVLEVDEQCSIESLTIVTEAEVSDGDDTDYEYPAGLMDFRLDCGEEGFTATISQYYYGVSGDFVVRKFKPDTGYFTIEDATTTDQTIASQQVKVATYQVTDGSNLDLDATVDGMIEDPAGLGQPNSLLDDLASTGQEAGQYVLVSVLLLFLATVPLAAYTGRKNNA